MLYSRDAILVLKMLRMMVVKLYKKCAVPLKLKFRHRDSIL